MAYAPTTWSDGDVITAEKMNKIRAGSTKSTSRTARSSRSKRRER